MSSKNENNPAKGEFSVEGAKHYYDFFKHLTTINTGSIVILVTFIQSFSKNLSQWKILISVGLGAFVISLISCLLGMASITFAMLTLGDTDQQPHGAGALAFFALLLSIVLFLAGIVAVVIFAIMNL